jgi:hypothetical protein
VSARESRIADGMAAVDAGRQRTLDAMETAAWAEAAMVNAEQRAKRTGPVFVDHFGVLFEVFWADACCYEPARDGCRQAFLTYWHEGARKKREYLVALMFAAALSSNAIVEAAMARDA